MFSKITIRMLALGCAVLLLAGTWAYACPLKTAGSCAGLKPAPKEAAAPAAACPHAKCACCKCAPCACEKCACCKCKPCTCG